VRVPPGFLEAPRETWAAMYLEWLHRIMTQLATLRGYDRTVLDDARDHCLARDLQMRIEVPPKRSRDRRHTAHLTYEIDAEGDRLVELLIRDTGGTVVGSSTTRDKAFLCTTADFRALARSLRWVSATSLEAEPGGPAGMLYRLVADIGRTRHGSLVRSDR
jgi:hypothetical protein